MMTDTDERQAAAEVNQCIWDEYTPRIKAKLQEIAEMLEVDGYTIRFLDDLSADNFQYALSVQRPDTDDDDNVVDITIQLAEAYEYGDEPMSGINWGLDLVEWGGRILGGLAPFNFTRLCWVDGNDKQAGRSGWLTTSSTSPPPLRLAVSSLRNRPKERAC
jgi:hypothetical protein